LLVRQSELRQNQAVPPHRLMPLARQFVLVYTHPMISPENFDHQNMLGQIITIRQLEWLMVYLTGGKPLPTVEALVTLLARQIVQGRQQQELAVGL
jgi:hypothetical protein